MTGPQHYREAEKWLHLSHEHTDTGDKRDSQLASLFAAQAQAHAMLAQAAATIDAADSCFVDWSRALVGGAA